jgi:hypothetical protein
LGVPVAYEFGDFNASVSDETNLGLLVNEVATLHLSSSMNVYRTLLFHNNRSEIENIFLVALKVNVLINSNPYFQIFSASRMAEYILIGIILRND